MRANRKGVAARRGLKGERDQGGSVNGSDSRGLMDKNRIEVPARRDAAKAVELTSGGLRRVRPWRTELVARRVDRVAEVSRGHSSPRGRMKARTEGVVSRTYVS